MFFGGLEVIARVKRNVLELYLSPNNEFYKLEIPQNVVSFLNVINEDYFVKYVMDFLIKLNKKSAKVDLVMDSEVVFEKTIPITSEETDKNSIESFFSSVPLEQNKIATKIFELNNQHILYATNSVYYNCIIKAFAKYGWRVNYVAPLGIFGFNAQNQVLGDEDLKLIRNGKKLAEKVNFLDIEKPKANK